MNNTAGHNNATAGNEREINPVVTFFLVLTVTFGISGNTLILVTVLRIASMKTVTNFLLANVAAADITTLFFSTLQYTLASRVKLNEGATSSFLCKFVINNSVSLVALLASLLTLTVLAYERYQVLLHPLTSYRRLSKDHVRYVSTVVWVVAIAVWIPLFIHQDFVKAHGDCFINGDQRQLNTYIYCVVVIFILLPCLIIVFCYFRIISGLYFTNTIWNSAAAAANTAEELRAKGRLVKLLVTITVMFFIAFVPYGISLILRFKLINSSRPSLQEAKTASQIQLASQVLILVNASANVIIYAFQSKNYRQGFKEVFRSIRCKN